LLRNFGAMHWLAEPKPTGRRLVRDGARAPPHHEGVDRVSTITKKRARQNRARPSFSSRLTYCVEYLNSGIAFSWSLVALSVA
jgi:hypothetical protein